MTRKPISVSEHEDIAPQLLDMQQGLGKLVCALFLSYPLDAPVNRAARKMQGACHELRQALQDECADLGIEAGLYGLQKQTTHG